jgi:hypothetical protein
MRGFVGIAIILTKNNTWVRVWTWLGLWVGELCLVHISKLFFHTSFIGNLQFAQNFSKFTLRCA